MQCRERYQPSEMILKIEQSDACNIHVQTYRIGFALCIILMNNTDAEIFIKIQYSNYGTFHSWHCLRRKLIQVIKKEP